LSPDEVARWVERARWRAAPGVAPALLAARLTALRSALAAAPAPRKAGRRKSIFALALAGPTPDHLLKITSHGHASLPRRLGPGAAANELKRAAHAAAAGVPTPVPLAAGAVRRRGLLVASLLLVPIVPGAADLARLWDSGRAPRRLRRQTAAALGVLARRLHDAGVDQDDLAPNNFLWRDDAEPRLLAIDFERVRIAGPLPAARRALALARLDRHLAGASAGDRMRVARAYGGDDAPAWWRAVAAAQAPLAARDFAHLLRTGTRASRRFVPITAGDVRGWAHREAPLADALAALAEAPGAAERVWLTPLGPLAPRAQARAWAAALVLAQRGVAPRPIAFLCRDGECHLAALRAPGSRPLANAAPADARAALPGLLDRLLAFGFAPEALALPAVALAPRPGGGMRAELLDPRGLRPGRVSLPPGGAKAWAERLLAALYGGPPGAVCSEPSTPIPGARGGPGSPRR
jgi:hypothetical protein